MKPVKSIQRILIDKVNKLKKENKELHDAYHDQLVMHTDDYRKICEFCTEEEP